MRGLRVLVRLRVFQREEAVMCLQNRIIEEDASFRRRVQSGPARNAVSR